MMSLAQGCFDTGRMWYIPVVGSLVHVRARQVLRREIGVPIYTPQRSTEAVAKTRSSLSGQRVVFAHDERDVWSQRVSQCLDTIFHVDLVPCLGENTAVVHQSALQCDAGIGRDAHVVVRSDQTDILLLVQPLLEDFNGVQSEVVVDSDACKARCHELSPCEFWTCGFGGFFNGSRATQPLRHIVRLSPAIVPVSRRSEEIGLVAVLPEQQVTPYRFAGVRNGCPSCGPCSAGVGAHVEAVDEPCAFGHGFVGLEVGRANGDDGRVVG